jgi:hypothetical protein
MCDTYTWQRRSLFIRDKPIHSSERALHKDYYRKGSVAKKKKISGREPQGPWRQDQLIGGKPPVVSNSDSASRVSLQAGREELGGELVSEWNNRWCSAAVRSW